MEGKEVKIVLEIAWLKQLMQVVEGEKSALHWNWLQIGLGWLFFSPSPSAHFFFFSGVYISDLLEI